MPLFLTHPSVFCIASPAINDQAINMALEEGAFPDWESDAPSHSDELVEFAGRACYQSFKNKRPGGNTAYIGHILESGHGSVAEHANITLYITGVSRSLTHELIRHRAGWAYSQLSQRFVDESDCNFVVPPTILNAQGKGIYENWKFATLNSLESYKALALELEKEFADLEDKTLLRKRAREAARSVLPNCTETRIVVTANVRAWRHFLELRGNHHADAEIHRLALMILPVLQAAAQNLFNDYRVVDGDITTKHKKV